MRFSFIVVISGFLLSALPGISQKLDVAIIEVDSITNSFKDQIPFDRKFILKIRADEKPPYIDYMENKGNLSWNETINHRLEKKFLGKSLKRSFTFMNIPNENISLVKENGISYLYIEFKEIRSAIDYDKQRNNFLKPSKKYTVIIPKVYDKAFDVFRLYSEDKDHQADSILNAIRKEQRDKLGLVYGLPDTAEARTLYDSMFTQQYMNLKTRETAFQRSCLNTGLLNSFARQPFLQKVLNELTFQNPRIHLPNGLVDTLVLMQGLNFLFNLDPNFTSKNILSGGCSLKDTVFDAKETSIESALSHLKETSAVLEQLEKYTSLLQARQLDADYGEALPNVRKLMTQIDGQIDSLTRQKKIITSIKATIVQSSGFKEPTIVGGSSYIYDFKTRSKLQITPDFGYVAYGFQKGLTSFTPYLGFNINFRPMDKNIPWRIYPNKTLLHRLAFMTGWTLAGVEKKGKRENFFSGSSLLTGIGFKLSNAIKINSGALWFYQNEPNPLLDGRTLKCTPYVGLSIDLDVREFLNDFTNLRPNLR